MLAARQLAGDEDKDQDRDGAVRFRLRYGMARYVAPYQLTSARRLSRSPVLGQTACQRRRVYL